MLFTTQITKESSPEPKVAEVQDHLQALTCLINMEEEQSVEFVREHNLG